MGVESKIRELMEGAANRPLDKQTGDATAPTQGSSDANPEMQDLSGAGNKEGGLTSEVGKAASGKASKDSTLPKGQGAGKAPNFSDEEDPKNVVAQASSKGNVAKEEVESEEEEIVVEEEIVDEAELEVAEEEEVISEDEAAEKEAEDALFEEDLKALFADEEHLSEDFKVKAANIFEAIVTSRVTSEVDAIEAELTEQYNSEMETAKEGLVESIDKYLSYVTENWMSENQIAIEQGIKTEVTESFIKGLQQVFTEHYIDIPEEKYDVLGEMQSKIDELSSKLDEQTQAVIQSSEEATQLRKEKVFAEVAESLASTEAEKFATLCEDISFGSEEMYRQKLVVVKENYFPKDVAESTEKLVDSVEGDALIENGTMAKYAKAISQSSKF